ncbi:MAG: hypothetical protein ABI210_13765 [Abditibacteriaceae bacterium]
MSTVSHFYQKVLSQPGLAQVVINISVLGKYLEQNDISVKRTDTVGRVKAATWSVDFGIAADEQTVHVTLNDFINKIPEKEKAYWLENIIARNFSENFLKMQGGHSCIDDGGLREWGEEEGLI